MTTYEVVITEILKKSVLIEAETMVKAERAVRDRYRNQDYVLTADDAVDVSFDVKSMF